MGRLRTYDCSDCTGRFEIFCHRQDDPAPDYCPLCGSPTLARAGGLATPSLAKGAAGPVDNIYKAMEEGAQFRAQKAEAMGASAAEAAGLKITDMRDNLRAGDTANIPVVNDVTRVMDAVPQHVGHVSQQQALAYAGNVASGPAPRAGARNIGALRRLHSTLERNPVHDAPSQGASPW
jgi:hypothetical protein